MKLSWLKLSIDICDDQKIKRIRRMADGDAMGWCWIAVLCMAMKSSRPGFLLIGKDIIADASDVAAMADVKEAVAHAAMIVFEKLGMIQVMKDGAVEVTNFRNHQDLERIEYRRVQATERQKRHRLELKQKTLQIGHASVTRDNDVTNALVTPIESKSKSKREIEIKKKNKENTKIASAKSDAIFGLKDLYDPFWEEAKTLDLIPSDAGESTSMFFSMVNVLRKHKREHIADGLKFAMRWLRYCIRKKRIPPGDNEKRKFTIGEIKSSLDYIRDRGLEATEALTKFAINDDFWSTSLFTIKNLYKAESKMVQEVT